MTTFIYGVFAGAEEISQALAGLKAQGLSEVVVLKDSQGLSYSSATVPPTKKTPFIVAGTIGGIVGAAVGAVASPTVPYTDTFQLITPIMAMVSGSVIFAYLAFWLAGFLYWVDSPITENEVFEASIPNGSVLLGVTVNNTTQKLKAIECFDNHGAIEIIARSEALPASELSISAPELIQTRQVEKLVA